MTFVLVLTSIDNPERKPPTVAAKRTLIPSHPGRRVDMTENHHATYASESRHEAHYAEEQHHSAHTTPSHSAGNSIIASGATGAVATVEAAEISEDAAQRYQEAGRIASDLFRGAPDWVTFYREVLGLNGIVRQICPTPDSYAEFKKTRQYDEIQRMLAKLREQNNAPGAEAGTEPTRVITVRLPKSLHEALRHEAHEKHTSMNKLCISKLLQYIQDELVPTE